MPESTHQLAAIMFTDIVGYAVLMGDNEEKAFNLLEKNRKLQKPLIDSYGGKWIKELGDGVLATFSTVSDAVYCAVAIQQETKNVPDLNLRVGIHEGEVVFQDGDVFGDGVNIASRLESIAPAGGIWVSEAVSRNIQNKHGIVTAFVREEQLKNVKDPVRIYEIKAEDVELPEANSNVTAHPHPQQSNQSKSSTKRRAFFTSLAIIILLALVYIFYLNQRNGVLFTEPDKPKSIAVLAFNYQSSEGDQSWLGEGFPETIRNVLANVQGLQVIGKTSSFSFKDKDVTTKEIGKILNVYTLLEGSVSKVGNNLRITASLIDAESGLQLWSDQYNRKWGDVNSIMDEVAEKVVTALKIELSVEELENIKTNSAVDPEALEYYLKGEYIHRRIYLLTRGKSDFLNSEQMFKKAISIDSVYPDAYAGLANLYDSRSEDAAGYLQKSDSVTQLASILNPNSAYVAFMQGMWALRHYDVDSAFFFYSKAHHLDPNNLGFLLQIAFTYDFAGLADESLIILKKVIEIDPLNTIAQAYSILSLQKKGEDDEARVVLTNLIEFDKNYLLAYYLLFKRVLFYDKDISEAKRIYQNLEELNPNRNTYQLALLLAVEGKREEALRTFPYPNMTLYSILNMNEEAISLVSSMSIAKEYCVQWSYTSLKNNQVFDFIRDEPKFEEILAKAKKIHEERVAKYGHLFDEE